MPSLVGDTVCLLFFVGDASLGFIVDFILLVHVRLPRAIVWHKYFINK